MKETILNRLSDEEFLVLANESNSVTDLSRRLGYQSNTPIEMAKIKNKLNSLVFDFNKFKGKKISVLNNLPQLTKVVSESYTYSDVLRKFNLAITGGNMRSVQRYVKDFNLNIEHFDDKKHLTNKKVTWTKEDIFIVNSPVETVTVRRRILKENLIPYQCNKCGNKGEWCGEPITLQLEHKNGNNKDHRLNNLEFLCPNCHSQTLTYGSKNKKGSRLKNKTSIIPVIKSDINNLINEISTYVYLDDILDRYKVNKQKLNRQKLIDMLTALNHTTVNLFLNNLKINAVKKIIFPEANLLLQQVKLEGYVAVAKKLNCSDNGIRKHLKKHGLI